MYPYETSLAAFLDKAYAEGLTAFEGVDSRGEIYRWELRPPHPQRAAPDHPDPRPWAVVRVSDGADITPIRQLPWPEWPSRLEGPDEGELHCRTEIYCEDAWAERLAATLGHTGPLPPADLAPLLTSSPYAARLHLSPGYRIEKPSWSQRWQVRGPDDRPWSGEHSTPLEAAAEALSAGVPTGALAPPGWLASPHDRAKLLQRIERWALDAQGCRALSAGPGQPAVALSWRVNPYPVPELRRALWDRIADAGPLTLGACLAASQTALDDARAMLTDRPTASGSWPPFFHQVEAKLQADWRAIALADIGLALWDLHRDAQILDATHDLAATARLDAGMGGPGRPQRDLHEQFAHYGPADAARSAIASGLVGDAKSAALVLAAPNALVGLSACWLEREERRRLARPDREEASPWWLQGWRLAVQHFGPDTGLTALSSVAFPLETEADFPRDVDWSEPELIELYQRWCASEGLPAIGADEQLVGSLTTQQRNWLSQFVEVWHQNVISMKDPVQPPSSDNMSALKGATP